MSRGFTWAREVEAGGDPRPTRVPENSGAQVPGSPSYRLVATPPLTSRSAISILLAVRSVERRRILEADLAGSIPHEIAHDATQCGTARARGELLRRYAEINALRAPDVVVATILSGPMRTSISQLAGVCAMSERSLTRRTAEWGLPSAQAMLAQTRCLQLTWLMECVGLSAKSAAAAGGFDSVQSFTHFVSRWMGQPPVKAMRQLGFARAWQDWRDSMECRWASRGGRA